MKQEITNVSKKEFQAYIKCQYSGITNMFDYSTVEKITGLSTNQISFIQKEYSTLKEIFGDIQNY